jgi:hypothetical protein
MSVAALSTAGFSQYIAASSNVSASDQAWESLAQSLASGNLTAAQTAFNSYQQINQNTSSSIGSSSGSQLSTDLKALGSAIGSGDLSTAQSAFATVQSDFKAAPPQSVSNAESAVAQTVQWVDDLLSLSTPSSAPNAPADPTTSILDAAYGLNPASSSTGPTTSILSSADDSPTTENASTPAPASSGNNGSSASVNVYA